MSAAQLSSPFMRHPCRLMLCLARSSPKWRAIFLPVTFPPCSWFQPSDGSYIISPHSYCSPLQVIPFQHLLYSNNNS